MHTETVIDFHPMRSATDAEAFRTLNEEWIARLFTLEEKDKRTLNDPEREIVARGGHVYLAEIDQQRIGAVALLSYGDGDYELSKMAVAPHLRGRGVGRRLIEYTLLQARSLGARRVFLGSNSTLANAVHLYESLGFRHVPPSELPYMGYARADIHMTHDLHPQATNA